MTDHKATKAVTTINKGPNELKRLLDDKGEKVSLKVESIGLQVKV